MTITKWYIVNPKLKLIISGPYDDRHIATLDMNLNFNNYIVKRLNYKNGVYTNWYGKKYTKV